MAIVHVAIDLAKNAIAVHGVDQHGKPALVRAAVPRADARLRALNALIGTPQMLAAGKRHERGRVP